MTVFGTTEASRSGSAPVELYLFRAGETEWAYAAAPAAVKFDGRTYAPETIKRTEVEDSQEDAAGSINVTLPVGNELERRFVGLQPTLPTYVTVFRVHADGAAGVEFTGRVAGWEADGPEARLACVPLPGALARMVPGLVFQKQCNWALYGAGCGVVASAFRDAAIVAEVDGYRVRAAAFAARADGWYAGGWIELRDGARAGDRRYVTSHAGEWLTLTAPFAGLDVDARLWAFAGCDRSETTCAAKFDNLARHLGFARIPTTNPHQGRMG